MGNSFIFAYDRTFTICLNQAFSSKQARLLHIPPSQILPHTSVLAMALDTCCLLLFSQTSLD